MRLLDTNVCIAFIKGEDATVKTRFRGFASGALVICSVVRAELLTGARASHRAAQNLTHLNEFLSRFVSLPFDDRAAEHFAQLQVVLRREGTPIGHYDAMIAAIALAHDLIVVTRNVREFSRVPGLAVEVW